MPSAQDRAMEKAKSVAMESQQAQKNLAQWLNSSLRAIKSVSAKHMTPERLCRIAVHATTRNPRLMEAACQAPETFVMSVVECASLGLEPVGPLGQAYLVPRWNSSTKRNEVGFIPGYRGYIELFGRSGRGKSISAEVVYEGDLFEVEMGTEQKLKHIPNWERAEDAKMICVYAIAHMKDGGYQFRVLTRADVYRARESSDGYKAAVAKEFLQKFNPWFTAEAEMWRKTAVRNLAKYLPLSPEIQQLATIDELRSQGMWDNASAKLDIDVELPALPEGNQSVIDAESEGSGIKKLTPEAIQRAKEEEERAKEELELATKKDKDAVVKSFKGWGIVIGDLEKRLSAGSDEPPLPFDDWTKGDVRDLEAIRVAGAAQDADKLKAFLIGEFNLEPGSLD